MTTLADLRKENLKQMNKTEETTAPSAAPTPDEPAREAAETGNTATSPSAFTEVRSPVSTEIRKDGSTHGRTGVRKSASTAVRTEASTDGGVVAATAPSGAAAPSPDSLLEAVREALAKKTVHPVGVKTTVEMPAELSQRAKRYSLDHGNIPVRQVFLELMIAFLEKEGY